MSAHCPSATDADSVFVSLLDALAPDPNDLVVLIQSYFDESWDDDVLCVAGYAFNSLRARKFDEAWRRMLWKNGRLPYFRMSACNHGSEPFDKLDKAARIKVQTEAISLITEYAAFGMAVTVEQEPFYRIIGKDGFVRSPYEFATWLVLTGVLTWMEGRNDINWASFFFEAGHQNQAQSQFLMNRIFSDEGLKRLYRYRSHSFVDKKASRPSQAADLLSWQWFKNMQRAKNGIMKPRADCAALIYGIEHRTSHLSERFIRMMVDSLDRRAGAPGMGNQLSAIALRDPNALSQALTKLS